MPKITFLNEAVTVDAQPGRTLREVAESAGVNLYGGFWNTYHCKGRGLCLGRGCRVWVRELAPGALSPKAGREMSIFRRVLRASPAMRLACQARVHGDVEVRTVAGAFLDIAPRPAWDPDARPARWKERLAPAPPPAKPAEKPAAAAAAAAAAVDGGKAAPSG